MCLSSSTLDTGPEMAHQASAAGAGAPHPAEASAGAAARPRAASGDAAVDADGTRWVPAGTSLPGVYVLSREGASAPSAAKAREADGAIRGLPPLFDDGADPIHRLAKVRLLPRDAGRCGTR